MKDLEKELEELSQKVDEVLNGAPMLVEQLELLERYDELLQLMREYEELRDDGEAERFVEHISGMSDDEVEAWEEGVLGATR